MSKTQSIVITPVLADDSKTLLVPVYYRVASDDVASDPASVNLAGVGAVVTFDSSKLTFDGYTAELGRDLFQGPTLFSESALRGSLEASGRTFAGLETGEIDGNASTDTGIAFNYIVANELFDDDPNTTWGGEIDWPGDEKALSDSGIKLFNLHFTAKDDYVADQGQTPINVYLSTTAPNYGAASSNGFAVLDAQTAGLSSISINSEAEFVAESAAGESTTVTFTVTRSGNLTGAATVNWRIKSSSEEDFVASTNTTDTSTDTNTDTTNNGRAASGRISGFLNDTVSTDDLTNGSDASGTVSFSADDGDSKTITITLSGDTTYEPDEELVVELSNPTGNAVLQSGKFRASTVIVNDDAPT